MIVNTPPRLREDECTCDTKYYCNIHVSCDDKCKALKEPKTLEELQNAYEHWMGHSVLCGCSHGR